MGRWGDGEMGRWGDGEMGRWGDGEMGRWGDGEMGRWGEFWRDIPHVTASPHHRSPLSPCPVRPLLHDRLLKKCNSSSQSL
jgi:hypothetical protein